MAEDFEFTAFSVPTTNSPGNSFTNYGARQELPPSDTDYVGTFRTQLIDIGEVGTPAIYQAYQLQPSDPPGSGSYGNGLWQDDDSNNSILFERWQVLYEGNNAIVADDTVVRVYFRQVFSDTPVGIGGSGMEVSSGLSGSGAPNAYDSFVFYATGGSSSGCYCIDCTGGPDGGPIAVPCPCPGGSGTS